MSAEPARHIDEAAFQKLVRAKWTISLVLTALILVIYFGFILVLAFAKDVLTAKIGVHMTLGLPVGLGVILAACILTGIYVYWANRTYDASVRDIIRSMRRK
ncbi:putative membrane protein, clustering with actp [hydrocarbon metagenome]|uniref:Putative membrane protein, clustering with actp n=1 Tax=hydrocarbon metagenome TaxID=938273 RepID=A0A0W8G586_9ZZZZ